MQQQRGTNSLADISAPIFANENNIRPIALFGYKFLAPMSNVILTSQFPQVKSVA
jgi:hypothetical protein